MIQVPTIESAPPNAMLLKNWLNKHGVSPEALAEKIRVSKPTIYNWIKGTATPLRAVDRELIATATNGEIQPIGWVTDDERAALAACTPIETSHAETGG